MDSSTSYFPLQGIPGYARGMTYVASEARQELLDVLGDATDEIGVAVEALSEAYELLDEPTGDRLEEQLFGPAQRALGRARRTHTEFAGTYDLPTREFAQAGQLSGGQTVKSLLERALDSVGAAERLLSDLQDSLLPVEVGDPAVRAGIADVRSLIGELPGAARELLRTFGR